MTDRVIEDIKNGEFKKEYLSPTDFRKQYRSKSYEVDENVREQLKNGRGIIEDINLLDQYLYSYGNMVNKQWDRILLNLGEIFFQENDIRNTIIIDYGCGQGLSILHFLYQLSVYDENSDILKSIVLIEPSKLALKRATALVEYACPNISIQPINKKLEELDKQDLIFDSSKVTIHIFSQILDILDSSFNITEFFETITNTEGKHYILVVSHDSDIMGGGNQIRNLYKYIVDEYIERPKYIEPPILFKFQLNRPRKQIKKFANIITLNNFQIDTRKGEKDCISILACIDTKVRI